MMNAMNSHEKEMIMMGMEEMFLFQKTATVMFRKSGLQCHDANSGLIRSLTLERTSDAEEPY